MPYAHVYHCCAFMTLFNSPLTLLCLPSGNMGSWYLPNRQATSIHSKRFGKSPRACCLELSTFGCFPQQWRHKQEANAHAECYYQDVANANGPIEWGGSMFLLVIPEENVASTTVRHTYSFLGLADHCCGQVLQHLCGIMCSILGAHWIEWGHVPAAVSFWPAFWGSCSPNDTETLVGFGLQHFKTAFYFRNLFSASFMSRMVSETTDWYETRGSTMCQSIQFLGKFWSSMNAMTAGSSSPPSKSNKVHTIGQQFWFQHPDGMTTLW